MSNFFKCFAMPFVHSLQIKSEQNARRWGETGYLSDMPGELRRIGQLE